MPLKHLQLGVYKHLIFNSAEAHEKEAFSGSLEVHMQPLQKIMSHSKTSR